MQGSWIAENIERDLRREKYWKHKKERQKCLKDGVKQCKNCKYEETCEDVEYKRNNIEI